MQSDVDHDDFTFLVQKFECDVIAHVDSDRAQFYLTLVLQGSL